MKQEVRIGRMRRSEMFCPLIIVIIFVGAVLFANGCGGGGGGTDVPKVENLDSNTDTNKNTENSPPDNSADPPLPNSDNTTPPSDDNNMISYQGAFKVIGSISNGYSLYSGGPGSAIELANGKIFIMSNAPGGMIKAEIYDSVSNTSQSCDGYIDSFDYHTATLLQDDKVLIIGVWSVADGNYSSKIAGRVIASFNPVSGEFTTIKREENYSLSYGHATALLNNGTLFVVGLNGAEIYNPANGNWESLEWQRRTYPNVVKLQDGRILITGGMNGDQLYRKAEIYDPVVREFLPTGNMIWPRAYSSVTRLSDGRVLFIGGASYENNKWEPLRSAEIFDPNLNGGTGGFIWVGDMSTPRRMHAAIELMGDMVLVAGGLSSSNHTKESVQASAEIFNPTSDAANSFTSTGQMINPRFGHTMVRHPINGNALIIGGSNGVGFQFAIEEYY